MIPDEWFDVERRAWDAVSFGAAAAAGYFALKLIERVWESSKGEPPPANPAREDVSWPDAIAWSAVTGLGIAVARLAARRGATSAWRMVVNADPPTDD